MTTQNRTMWFLVPVLLLAIWGSSASAVETVPPRKIAIVSLIGDSLTIVHAQQQLGSRIDRNSHESISILDGSIDREALLASDDAIKNAAGQTSTVLLKSSSTLSVRQADFFDGQKFVPPSELETSLKTQGATHLLLLTKFRAEARFESRTHSVGHGMIEGVGFYFDRQTVTYRTETGERGIGFLAPYAYFKVSLIELATLSIVKQQTITASWLVSEARSREKSNPWDALTPTEKANSLRFLIKREVLRAVAELVGTS